MANKPGNIVGRVFLWFEALIIIIAAYDGVAWMMGWSSLLQPATFGQIWLAWIYVVIVLVAVIYALIALIAYPFTNRFS